MVWTNVWEECLFMCLMFITCHLFCSNFWLGTFIFQQIKQNIKLSRDWSKQEVVRRIFWFGFIQSIDKSKNQTKLAKLPGTNFVFIFSNIYVFYIYLFIALGIFCNINLSSFQKIFMLGWLLTKSHILFILQLIWNQFSKSHVTLQASCKWL